MFSLDVLQVVSKLSGILSLFIWLFAQLPQVVENHLNKLVEGVSLLFLLLWTIGDATNLIGGLLTGALPFQVLLAAYYCFIDCILGLQFWYYTRVLPFQKYPVNLLQSPRTFGLPYGDDRTNRFPDQRQKPFRCPSGKTKRLVVPALAALAMAANEVGAQCLTLPGMLQLSSSVKASSESHNSSSWDNFGKISAWTCSALYLSSRAPQILKNFNNRSTKGVTVYLFLFAMLGNIFYSISVICDLLVIKSTSESLFTNVFNTQLPFLVGSTGTLGFDFILIAQCWLYRNHVDSLVPLDASPSHNQKSIREAAGPVATETNKRKSKNLLVDLTCLTQLARQEDILTGSMYTPLLQGPHSQYKSQSERQAPNSLSTSPKITQLSRPIETKALQSLPSQSMTSQPMHHQRGSSGGGSSGGRALQMRNFLHSLSKTSVPLKVLQSLPIGTSKKQVIEKRNRLHSTSHLPELVGSYISLSRKMSGADKTPFSPKDFLGK